ncbi:hypothetical protein ACIRD2_28035 [Streptomyces sp. NPDC093595]|uniref:hypothetical protein n=1 Tax=Streptomyces sp. NPDC093595 TaxID=3366045 RepID=UPI003809A52F
MAKKLIRTVVGVALFAAAAVGTVASAGDPGWGARTPHVAEAKDPGWGVATQSVTAASDPGWESAPSAADPGWGSVGA